MFASIAAASPVSWICSTDHHFLTEGAPALSAGPFSAGDPLQSQRSPLVLIHSAHARLAALRAYP